MSSSRRLAFVRLPALGWVAVLCLVCMVIVAIVQIGALVPLTLRGAVRTPDVETNDGVATFQAGLVRDAQRVDNRSPFFVPPRPAPKPTERPVQVDKPVERPKPVEATPAKYGGPSIIAILGDSVWLDTGSRVTVGDENDGVRIVSVQAPWSVRVAWRGSEFDVTLFERTTGQFLTGGEPSADPSIEGPDDIEEDTDDGSDNDESGDDGDEPEDDEDGDA